MAGMNATKSLFGRFTPVLTVLILAVAAAGASIFSLAGNAAGTGFSIDLAATLLVAALIAWPLSALALKHPGSTASFVIDSFVLDWELPSAIAWFAAPAIVTALTHNPYWPNGFWAGVAMFLAAATGEGIAEQLAHRLHAAKTGTEPGAA